MNTRRFDAGKCRRQRLLTLVLSATSLLLLGLAGNSLHIAQAQSNDGGYETEMNKGLDLLRRHRYEDALKSFKHANELRDKKCAECFYGMAQAYQGLQAYKNVVESCDKMIELATKKRNGAASFSRTRWTGHSTAIAMARCSGLSG